MDVQLPRNEPPAERKRESYQVTLRVIGAWLDEAWAINATVIETPRGWSVRYGFELSSPPTLLKQFNYAAVRDMEAKGQKQRGTLTKTDSRTGRHQDLLRIIGFELDSAAARNVLIDQIGPDLLVTFEVVNPAQGFNWRKEILVVGPDLGDGLLEKARHRRAPAPDHAWFSWLWSPSGGR